MHRIPGTPRAYHRSIQQTRLYYSAAVHYAKVFQFCVVDALFWGNAFRSFLHKLLFRLLECGVEGMFGDL